MKIINTLYTKDKNMSRLLIIFFASLILFGITKGSNFFNLDTMKTILVLFPEYGFLAIGMALALFTGGIDLSVVYQANFCSIMIAKVLTATVDPAATIEQAIPGILLSILVALIAGMFWGAINGLLIAGVGIPPILATLGMQTFILGVSMVITGGSTISGIPSQLSQLFKTEIIGIPLTAILFLVVAILVGLMLTKTKLGYRLKMYGTNSIATTFSGINNIKLLVQNHMIIGVLSACASIVMITKMTSAKADNGIAYTMQAILIAVLGGMSPNGGKGNIQGVVVAIVIVQMISTWLTMFSQISTVFLQIIWGVLLLSVLIFNYMTDEMEQKKAMKG